MKLGSFLKDQYGALHGKIHGLGIGVTSVILEPQMSKEGKPYFKVIADPMRDAYEIGAAFEKQKDDKTYYTVSLESPALAAPLNGALFPDKEDPNTFNLIWDRPAAAKPEAKADIAPQGRKYVGASATL